MKPFIDAKNINAILEKASLTSRAEAEKVIKKALLLKGLSPEETAILLENKDKTVTRQIFRAASRIKEKIYGKRLVLFAPLYISNYCTNNCLYCGFRSGNKRLLRKRLTIEEIKQETIRLEKEGQKRLLLVGGEDPVAGSVTFLEKALAAIYQTKYGYGEIRRLNVNVAPMSIKGFKRLKKCGIGTYQLFQETYHLPTYKEMHPKGPKADYIYRLFAMHRAAKAGIDDVGIGVLFGLYNYKFEVLALLYHARELEKKFGAGPHTISVPRLEPALGAPITQNSQYKVSDDDFKKLVAILRLAVPYTGIILSTRESAKLRNELLALGVSQISAGSRTTPGGYQHSTPNHPKSEQFAMSDHRSLLEVIKDISRLGYNPSFCTACYRRGRTGKDFMDLAKPGLIAKYCLPNSLMTFKEYLLDYGDRAAQKLGEKLIKKQLKEIPNQRLRSTTKNNLKLIEKGGRDIYF